jgi:CheY-like chemotaxis protein
MGGVKLNTGIMVILCIDDDSEDVELFCEAVRTIDEKHTCVVAKNGQHGLDVLKYLHPDFIFLDVNMPVLDGVSTLQIIRDKKDFKQLPICIYSTTITSRDVEFYKNLGADHCIVKPNNFDKLCDSLRKIFAPPTRHGAHDVCPA